MFSCNQIPISVPLIFHCYFRSCVFYNGSLSCTCNPHMPVASPVSLFLVFLLGDHSYLSYILCHSCTMIIYYGQLATKPEEVTVYRQSSKKQIGYAVDTFCFHRHHTRFFHMNLHILCGSVVIIHEETNEALRSLSNCCVTQCTTACGSSGLIVNVCHNPK